MADAWRSYLEMAYGLTKTSQKKAQKAVRELVGKSNAKAGELQSMAEDLMATGMANRDAITTLVRDELDRALGRVGLAKADELKALKKRVADLEEKLNGAPDKASEGSIGIAPVGPVAAEAKAAQVAKKAPVKKAVARKVAEPAPAKATPAKKTVTKKTAAKKTTPGAGSAQ